MQLLADVSERRRQKQNISAEMRWNSWLAALLIPGNAVIASAPARDQQTVRTAVRSPLILGEGSAMSGDYGSFSTEILLRDMV